MKAKRIFKSLVLASALLVAGASESFSGFVFSEFKRDGNIIYVDLRDIEVRDPASLRPPIGSSTTATDCDEVAEEGRIFVSTGSGTSFFLCQGTSGWVQLASGGGGAALNVLEGGVIQITGASALDFNGDDFDIAVAGTTGTVSNPYTRAVSTNTTQTLAGKTLTSPVINSPALSADSVDAITEIAAALKSGSDGTLVTGTAGTSGNCSEWDANGDLVDAGAACGSGTGGDNLGSHIATKTVTMGFGMTSTTGTYRADAATNIFSIRDEGDNVTAQLFDLYGGSKTTPANLDRITEDRYMMDSTRNFEKVGSFQWLMIDVTDGTEDSRLNINLINDGTLATTLSIGQAQIIYNSASVNMDHIFNVLGDLGMFIDGESGTVHISSSAGSFPDRTQFSVTGDQDFVQMLVQGNESGNQTSNLVVYRDSSNNDIFIVNETTGIHILNSLALSALKSTGTFDSLSASSVTTTVVFHFTGGAGTAECLQRDVNGRVTGTGSACGSGGGGSGLNVLEAGVVKLLGAIGMDFNGDDFNIAVTGSTTPVSIAYTRTASTNTTQTLAGKTLTSPVINNPALSADSVDAITEVAAALKSGSDGTFVTGTAGSNTDCAQWNGDGDLVTSGDVCGSGGGDNLGSHVATKTVTMDFGLTASTAVLNHTATQSDDHVVEITVDAAGFADIKVLEINYITGPIGAGSEDSISLINVDETLATGGDVIGWEMLTTEGSANVIGLSVGPLISPVRQLSGIFSDPESGVVVDTDNLASFTSTTSNVNMFAVDNDSVTIGNSAKFEDIEILFSTVASGAGIAAIFNYSTGVDTWGSFTPTDGTDNGKNSGIIQWFDEDISDWAVGVNSEFLISIVRTRNSLTTIPVESKIQISSGTLHEWNKEGDVNIHSVTVSSWTRYVEGVDNLDITAPELTANRQVTFPDAAGEVSLLGQTIDLTSEVTGTLPVGNGGIGVATLTDGGILLGSGSGAITALGVATNGQIPIGDGTGDPQLATITGGNDITITNGAASITVDADSTLTRTADIDTFAELDAIVADQVLFHRTSTFTVCAPAMAAAMASTGAAVVETFATTTNGVLYDYMNLSKGSTDYVAWDWTSPKSSWDASTFTFRAVWTSTGGSAGETFAFGLSILSLSDDDPNDTSYGTEIVVTDIVTAAGDNQATSYSGAVIPGGTSIASGDIWHFKARRVLGSDNVAGNIQLKALDVCFDKTQIND